MDRYSRWPSACDWLRTRGENGQETHAGGMRGRRSAMHLFTCSNSPSPHLTFIFILTILPVMVHHVVYTPEYCSRSFQLRIYLKLWNLLLQVLEKTVILAGAVSLFLFYDLLWTCLLARSWWRILIADCTQCRLCMIICDVRVFERCRWDVDPGVVKFWMGWV